jgi:glycosyltransferase involved in cell wall biosynthesis
MCEDKGLPLLVEAFIALRRRGRVPDLCLGVAGVELAEDRPLVEKLRRRLRDVGLAEEVKFLPNVDAPAKWDFLRSLSVLSVPAQCEESFGLYLIEAMAVGVPVVQPRHAAFPEILGATGGGLLCEPGDPGALADAIESLLLDPERARRLGEAGRAAVLENFTAERMASEVEAMLLAVASPERKHEA